MMTEGETAAGAPSPDLTKPYILPPPGAAAGGPLLFLTSVPAPFRFGTRKDNL